MELNGKGRTIALIPARSGSKRIQGKNVRILAGKPLIQWTIEQAKRSTGIDEIVVSSNDPIVRDISSALNVNFLERPERLCGDESKISEVIEHFLAQYSNFDNLILLQPTCPLRSVNFIEECLIELANFKENTDVAVVSVSEHQAPLEWLFIKEESSFFLKPLIEFDERQFQQTTKVYTFNGAVYCANISGLRKAKYIFGNMQIRPLFQEEGEILDIDTEEDFIEAERIMKIMGF